MVNVDAIYVVALPSRIADISLEMAKHDIDYIPINAVEDENGIKGLQLSMEKVFLDALSRKYKAILVFEDDAVFECEYPVDKINKCISELPEEFDCLQLGGNLVLPPEDYSTNLLKVKYSLSTHAIVYSRKAIFKILPLMDKETHLDALIYKNIQCEGNCFCAKEILVNQRDGYSFIEKRQTKYGSMMRRKYNSLVNGNS